MTRDEHKNAVNQLLSMVTPEQQAAASELLTTLSDDYEQTLTNVETLTTRNETLTTNNETLREVNAKLFLKVGQTEKDNHDNPGQGKGGEGNEPPTLNYEDLFDEKGALK